jgi:enoyl-CoA hydratase/carnithine racemase
VSGFDDFETVLVEVSPDRVASVTLNRPEALNSFNQQMRSEFARLWPALQASPDVHAVVLRSAGGRAFSTGLDVKEHGAGEGPAWVDAERPWDELEDPGSALGPKRNGVWKPVIAAVDGMCAGGAFYWVAEADIVLATPEATFFDPHVTYGMVAAVEPILLSYRMRVSDVLRMALMGLHERMSAAAARDAGLVSEIVPPDDLDAHSHRLAAAIASQPTAAVQGTVKAVWQALGQERGTALATALLYTQVGNPLGVAGLDRSAAKPATWALR